MRGISFTVLVLSVVGLAFHSSAAQELKTEPKTEPKQPEINWPDRIQGKSLTEWINVMKTSKDASMRDEAIRTIPFFGPESRKAVGHALIDVIKNDADLNVCLTAISTVPLIGFDTEYVDQGLDAMLAVLKSQTAANHTKFETTNAIGNCGPLFKRAIPTIITYTLADPRSWQNRKAAATALGRLGQPMGKDSSPSKEAIVALARTLHGEKRDLAHQVRREAISALMQLGPPTDEASWKLLRAALTDAMKDTDKSVALWAHVAFTRTEQELIKPNDPNLLAVVKVITDNEAIIKAQEQIEAKLAKALQSTDPTTKLDAQQKKQTAMQIRLEAVQMKQDAIQALGVIGEEAKSRLPDLIAIAQTKGEEPSVIATTLWAMSQMPSETARILPVIDDLKRAEDKTIKAAAEAAYRLMTVKPEPEVKTEPPPR